jgi:hypothetical protein
MRIIVLIEQLSCSTTIHAKHIFISSNFFLKRALYPSQKKSIICLKLYLVFVKQQIYSTRLTIISSYILFVFVVCTDPFNHFFSSFLNFCYTIDEQCTPEIPKTIRHSKKLSPTCPELSSISTYAIIHEIIVLHS